MVFFVSFPLPGGWRKIPCLFLSGYPVCTLRCNTRGCPKSSFTIYNTAIARGEAT
jgi:hypothetical protein